MPSFLSRVTNGISQLSGCIKGPVHGGTSVQTSTSSMRTRHHQFLQTIIYIVNVMDIDSSLQADDHNELKDSNALKVGCCLGTYERDKCKL